MNKESTVIGTGQDALPTERLPCFLNAVTPVIGPVSCAFQQVNIEHSTCLSAIFLGMYRKQLGSLMQMSAHSKVCVTEWL